MKILAIETSHDDTSVVLYQNKKILEEISYSQTDFHKMFGGTIPEYASRGHFNRLPQILDKFLKNQDIFDIDHIAYTSHPGLVGSLHMGKIFAKSLGFALNKPVYPINHMFGHIYAVCFTEEIIYPAVALIVSGGHSQLWEVKSIDEINLIGETKDDAIGEVYDKIARKMGLGFPGGPIIDKLSQQGQPNIDFSIKLQENFDFSFSGIKTKIINFINNKKQKKQIINKPNICASFQEAAVENLINQTKKAISQYNPKSVILGGGVAANSRLRQEFSKIHINALIPSLKYTTDNAMMIAIRSHIKQKNGK